MKKFILGAIVASVLVAVPTVIASGGNDGNTLNVPSKTLAKLKSGTKASFIVTDDAFTALQSPSTLTGGWHCSKTGVTPANCVSSGGTWVANGTGPAVTVSCTGSQQVVNLANNTYSDAFINLPSGPTFTSCKDNITLKPDYATYPTTGFPSGCTKTGCTEHLTSNTGSGPWQSRYNDDLSESGNETLGAGDSIDIQSPAGGLTSFGNGTPVCLITVNPAGTDAPANGTYNDSTAQDNLFAQPTSFSVAQNPAFPTPTFPACPLTGDTGHAAFSGVYILSPRLTDS